MKESYFINKTFKFEAAHRIWKQDLSNSRGCEFTPSNQENKCTNIHGHSYKIEVIFTADNLDKQDMIMDFYHVKNMLKDYIDYLDHSIMLDRNDPIAEDFLKLANKYGISRVRVLNFHPTSENLAKHFYEYIENLLKQKNITDVRIYKVIVHETESGCAEYRKDISI